MDAPENLDALRAHIDRALKIMRDREPEYRKAREYADGTRAEIAGSKVAEKVIEQSKGTPISFAHIPIEVVAEKVTVTGIASEDDAVNAALEAWAEANGFEDEAPEWIREACTLGDWYVITDPTGFDDDDVATLDDVDSVGISPLSAVVVYDRKTKRIPEYGMHVWSEGSDSQQVTKAMLFYNDSTIELTTAASNGESTVSGRDFVYDVDPDDDEDEAVLTHEGGRMLISHLAIGGRRPYGKPIHRRAWAFQDAIAKISANGLVDIDAAGLPSRWALLDPAAEIDDDIDDDFGTDGSITASPEDGMTTPTKGKRVRALPGAINFLRGVKSTGTYAATGADPFLKSLDWYVRGMAVATGVPLFEFDMSGEIPSGESRRRAEARVNKTARAVQRQAMAFLEDVARTVLAVTATADEADIVINFAPIESSSDKEGLELVALKVKAGVPVRVALIEAGYPAEVVEEWMGDRDSLLSPDLLSILAEVLAKLGNAQTLQAITPEEVRAMLPEILTGARGEGPAAEPEVEIEDAEIEPIDAAPEVDPELGRANAAKAKADALGALVRAGAEASEAAAYLGLTGISFPNVPTTVRLPEDAAAELEGGTGAPAAPSAPTPPGEPDVEPALSPTGPEAIPADE